jgi:hypothetical protein
MVDKKGGGKGGGKSASNDLKAQVNILDLSVFSQNKKMPRQVTRARSQVDRLAFEKTALQARLRELPLHHQEKLEPSNHARLQINN